MSDERQGRAIPYREEHPSATVVALAGGLQTSFWRLDATIDNREFH